MSNETKFTRDYFIAKFEAIPDDKWCVELLRDNMGRCCALGHCGGFGLETVSPEAGALEGLFNIPHGFETPWISGAINDGKYARYQQATPKARILAALRDLPA